MRHTLLRKPPFPIYIGLNMHQLTRSKKLVQQLYRMGICIAYDRVRRLKGGLQLQLLNDSWKMELFHLLVFKMVCSLLVPLPLTIWTLTPVQLLHSLFMECTGISLFQLPFNEKKEMKRKTWCGQTACHNTLSITNEKKNLVWPDSLSQYHHYLGVDFTLCLTTMPLSQPYL